VAAEWLRLSASKDDTTQVHALLISQTRNVRVAGVGVFAAPSASILGANRRRFDPSHPQPDTLHQAQRYVACLSSVMECGPGVAGGAPATLRLN